MVQWTGYDAANYRQRTREATDIIRRLFRGEVVHYDGEEFQWSEQCYLRFKPYREALPIYICAFGEDYLGLSGEIGDGSLPMITPPESASYMVPAIQKGLAANPLRELYVISGCAWLSLSDTREAAADNMRKMVAYFGPYLEDPALATVGLSGEDFEPIAALIAGARYEEAYARVTDDMLRLGIVGTPGDVIGQIERLADLGINEVNLGGPLGPDPAAAIRLMGQRVIPHFR
jgi:5,10-methylenetetrahydromethanopterin reductase